MSDAWMVRGSERQELLEKLKQRVMEIEESPLSSFNYELVEVCLAFLKDETITPSEGEADQFFFNDVLSAISEFSRAEEECKVMICDFLQWLIESIISRFRSDLLRKEVAEPQTIFHASSATEQI